MNDSGFISDGAYAGSDGDSDDASSEAPSARQQSRRKLYGGSQVSTFSRIETDRLSRREERKARPTHDEYAARMLDESTIRAIVVDDHRCHQTWDDEGETVQCHHQLWARGTATAVRVLRDQRKTFLDLGSKERGELVLKALGFESSSGGLHCGDDPRWKAPVAKVVFRLGPTPDRLRPVCRCIFLAQYPISLATLKRIIQRKRIGADLYARLGDDIRMHKVQPKTLHVVAWALEYANQV